MNRRFALFALAVLGVGFLTGLPFLVQAQATYVVNDFTDNSAGICPGPTCTLRAALIAAAAGDTILFTTSGTIFVNASGGLGELPTLAVDGITIDAQGNQVILDGSLSLVTDPPLDYGLRITSDSNRILGLNIQNFAGDGLIIEGGNSNLIGDVGPGQGNIIHLNGRNGILLDGAGALGEGNVIQGNLIGTNDIGSTNEPNGAAGIRLQNGSDYNVIGGATTAARNIISGNAASGIVINSSSNTLIQGNRIGLDSGPGITGLGNGTVLADAGILIENGSQDTQVVGNVIASGAGDGVTVVSSDGAQIRDNVIGLDAAFGFLALGNSGRGIQVSGSSDAIIENNTIAANVQGGVRLSGGSTNSIVRFNRIGVAANGVTAQGNGDHGIQVIGANDNTLTGNLIANNNGDGVFIDGSSGVTVTANAIYNNAQLGIDIAPDGVTAGFPVLLTALFDGVSTTIVGSLSGAVNTDWAVEVFSNAVCDPSNFGEGQFVTGITAPAATDASGNAAFSISAAGLAVGQFVTVTATQVVTGSTTEFSNCIPVQYAAPTANFSANPVAGSAPLAVTFTDLSTGVIDTYLWDFGDGGSSTQQNPSYSYTVPGTYIVTLTVTGPGGADQATRSIVVSVLPTATQPRATSQVFPSPTITLTPTGSPLATSTPSLTWTPRPTLTFTPTATQVPSQTPSFTPSATSTPRPTLTFTATSTRIPSSTPTLTATTTASPTLVPTATFTATVPPTPTPQIGVTKIVDGENVAIVIDNTGPGEARNIGLIESLRPGVRYIASRPGAPVCIEDAGVVFCELGTLAGGSSTSVDLTLRSNGVDPASGQTVVTSDGVRLVVIDEPYLFKIGEPPVAAPGTQVIYTLRVINPTIAAVNQIEVNDLMPDALDVISAEASAGRVVINGQQVRFSLDRLEAGGRVTIRLVTRVRTVDAGFNQIVNRACLSSASNRVPSCAEMRFLRASEIPATGETPWYRQILLVVLAALGVLGFVITFRSRRATPKA